jgi:nitrite reductase (NADH) small subunit
MSLPETASRWLEVGALTSIPRRGARTVDTPRGSIAVFRTTSDEVFALRNACPHLGGPLSEGIVHGRRVTCPLHSWKLCLDTGNAVAPDSGCADRFEVEVSNGIVYLSMEPRA